MMETCADLFLIWVALAAGWTAVAAANLARRTSQPPIRPTVWGLLLWLAVAIPSGIQFVQPGLLGAWMRNGRILQQGQWWRIVTGNLVQDGGATGTISNLAVMAVTVLIVARAIRGRVAVPLFCLGGVGSMLLQLSHPGAGNSMATLALLAATVVIVTIDLGRPMPTIVGLVILTGSAAVLTALADQHGPALLLGLVLGVGFRAIMMLPGRRQRVPL